MGDNPFALTTTQFGVVVFCCSSGVPVFGAGLRSSSGVPVFGVRKIRNTNSLATPKFPFNFKAASPTPPSARRKW